VGGRGYELLEPYAGGISAGGEDYLALDLQERDSFLLATDGVYERIDAYAMVSAMLLGVPKISTPQHNHRRAGPAACQR